jgi:Na+/melibiose symporter-like transporter
MKKYLKLVVVLPLLLISIIAFAHPGRTDANGGHYNHSTGEYHYHNGNSTGSNTGLNFKTNTDYSDVIKEYDAKKKKEQEENVTFKEKNTELTKEVKQLKAKNNTLNNQIEILSKIGTALICFSSIVLSIILYKIIIILPESIKNIIGFLSAFLVWFCVVLWFWYWVNDGFGIKYIYNGLLNLSIVDTLKGIGVFVSVPLIILSTIAVYYETRRKDD